jgi:hypothetical protein
MMLNEPSLAILIDCWLLPNHSELYNNIIEHLDNNPNIKTVVLASYNCKTEFVQSRSLWYTNYNLMFRSDHVPRKIKELTYVHHLHLVRDNTYAVEQTNPIVLNYVNSEKFQIAMHWAWQLEYYLSLNPEIKNVYVFGEAWEVCVEKRTLGYVALTEIQGISILTNINCVKSNDGTTPKLDLDEKWVNVSKDTYKYIG